MTQTRTSTNSAAIRGRSSLTALTLAGCLCLTGLAACAAPKAAAPAPAQAAAQAAVPAPHFEKDRQAILAMTGDYRVSFDFEETVPLADGYELKPEKLSGGFESVRVIEDTGRVIRLQHILVAETGDGAFPIKHWRQDWIYEPERVFVYSGNNTWEARMLTDAERAGKWAQLVYQVDDAPRYGAVTAWTHENGVSTWDAPAEWRPLPRRDATTRDDYDVVDAANQHTIIPAGWVHEQDNTKVVLRGTGGKALVREIGVNSYIADNNYSVETAEDYWAATEDLWAAVRDTWDAIIAENDRFGLTVQGEPEPMYLPILAAVDELAKGDATLEDTKAEVLRLIDEFTWTGEPSADS